MQKIAIFFLLLLMAASCQSGSGKDKASANNTPPDLKKALPGTWESIALRVQVNTAQGKDSSFVLEVKEGEWRQRLGKHPVRTHYSADNKYRQTFKGSNDSVRNATRGIWNVFGDTLMMIEPNATYQYTVELEDNRATYRAQLDWDGDGEEDDEYLEVQRRVKEGQ